MIGRRRGGAAALVAVCAGLLSATAGCASAETGQQIAQELADRVAPGELILVSAGVSYSTGGTSYPVVFGLRSDPDAAVSVSVRESCRRDAAPCDEDLRAKVAAAGPAAERARILVASFARCGHELLGADGEGDLMVAGDVAVTETAVLAADVQRCLDGWRAARAASDLPDGREPRDPDVTVLAAGREVTTDLPLVARLAVARDHLEGTAGIVFDGGATSPLRIRPNLRGADGQVAGDRLELAAAEWAVDQGLVPGPAEKLAEGGGAFFRPQATRFVGGRTERIRAYVSFSRRGIPDRVIAMTADPDGRNVADLHELVGTNPWRIPVPAEPDLP